jgi:hypothetical protein
MNKISHKLKKSIPRRKNKRPFDDNSGVPRITNDTVAEHREEVLSSARKYIYPLQHSRHRIVIISVVIFTALILAFFTYTLLALYRFNATSTFMYRVTQVVPFPVARAGSSAVAYEEYLFELRRYMHYYETQQEVDFASDAGREQLADFRKRALESVITTAFVKQVAKEQGVFVSRSEIDKQIDLLRSQNRLGGNDEVFEDVLREFWNWSTDDFRRQLADQLLAQKVASKLDQETHDRAKKVLAEARNGGDFAALAKKHSDDVSTKGNGGDYGFTIERSNREIQPEVMDQLFKLEKGKVSGVIETATGLEILKLTENENGKIQAAHITFNFKPVNTYVDPLKKERTVWRFIST